MLFILEFIFRFYLEENTSLLYIDVKIGFRGFNLYVVLILVMNCCLFLIIMIYNKLFNYIG